MWRGEDEDEGGPGAESNIGGRTSSEEEEPADAAAAAAGTDSGPGGV